MLYMLPIKKPMKEKTESQSDKQTANDLRESLKNLQHFGNSTVTNEIRKKLLKKKRILKFSELSTNTIKAEFKDDMTDKDTINETIRIVQNCEDYFCANLDDHEKFNLCVSILKPLFEDDDGSTKKIIVSLLPHIKKATLYRRARQFIIRNFFSILELKTE